MSLIHDDGLVLEQVLTAQRLTQQHTICHVLDERLVRRAVLKADGIAHLREAAVQQQHRQDQAAAGELAMAPSRESLEGAVRCASWTAVEHTGHCEVCDGGGVGAGVCVHIYTDL